MDVADGKPPGRGELPANLEVGTIEALVVQHFEGRFVTVERDPFSVFLDYRGLVRGLNKPAAQGHGLRLGSRARKDG